MIIERHNTRNARQAIPNILKQVMAGPVAIPSS